MATMKTYIFAGLLVGALTFTIIWFSHGHFVTFVVSNDPTNPTIPPPTNLPTPLLPPTQSLHRNLVTSPSYHPYMITVQHSEMAFNLTGIILLNVCILIGQAYHLYGLQTMDDTLTEKPVIFLLQQSSIMQLFSFTIMNVIYYDLFLADGKPFEDFTVTIFNMIDASVTSQSIFLVFFVFARAFVMYRVSIQEQNQLRFLIAFKFFVFILVNMIVFSLFFSYRADSQHTYQDFESYGILIGLYVVSPICALILIITSLLQCTKWRNIKSLNWLMTWYVCVIKLLYVCGLPGFLCGYISPLYPTPCFPLSEAFQEMADSLNMQLSSELRATLALISFGPLCNNLLCVLYSPLFVGFLTRYCCREDARNELRQPLLTGEGEPIGDNDIYDGQQRPHAAPNQNVFQQEPPPQKIYQQEPPPQKIYRQEQPPQNSYQQEPPPHQKSNMEHNAHAPRVEPQQPPSSYSVPKDINTM